MRKAPQRCAQCRTMFYTVLSQAVREYGRTGKYLHSHDAPAGRASEPASMGRGLGYTWAGCAATRGKQVCNCSRQRKVQNPKLFGESGDGKGGKSRKNITQNKPTVRKRPNYWAIRVQTFVPSAAAQSELPHSITPTQSPVPHPGPHPPKSCPALRANVRAHTHRFEPRTSALVLTRMRVGPAPSPRGRESRAVVTGAVTAERFPDTRIFSAPLLASSS